MPTAIRTENLSKIYRLGEIGTGTISRDLERWWARMRGKEDPFLKIGQANDRAVKGDSDIVYSLRDINFEIQQGEAVGIIGKNGAGKSTLLKILSRVTSPTTGKIEIKGRIASLLEVGTGFHPELTGRENIYLNGAILGMRKKEITRKLDEIIDFSGVERYIDTPVKRYSSGMYVRLAFAVAAHLESEILIVDEVLAVGDAEFQKKCLGKMNDVSKNDGRTILFVSHNMAAVQSLCRTAIVLEDGIKVFNGEANDAVNTYLNVTKKNNSQLFWGNGYFTNDLIDILSVKIESKDKKTFTTDSQLEIEITLEIKKSGINILMDICLYNTDGLLVFDVVSKPTEFLIGSYKLMCKIPRHLMNTGNYTLDLIAVQNHNSVLFKLKDILSFEIEEGEREIEYYSNWPGIIRPRLIWEINNFNN